jgi:hypothetical protein
VFVKASPEALNGKATPFNFVLRDNATGAVVEHPTHFAAPAVPGSLFTGSGA